MTSISYVDYNKSVPKYVEKSLLYQVYFKCGSMHTLMAKIAHNPLRFGKRFCPELQTRIKHVRKTTNVVDALDQALGREVCKKSFELLTINI